MKKTKVRELSYIYIYTYHPISCKRFEGSYIQ